MKFTSPPAVEISLFVLLKPKHIIIKSYSIKGKNFVRIVLDIIVFLRKFQSFKCSQYLSATTIIVQQTQSYLSIKSKYEAGFPN